MKKIISSTILVLSFSSNAYTIQDVHSKVQNNISTYEYYFYGCVSASDSSKKDLDVVIDECDKAALSISIRSNDYNYMTEEKEDKK